MVHYGYQLLLRAILVVKVLLEVLHRSLIRVILRIFFRMRLRCIQALSLRLFGHVEKGISIVMVSSERSESCTSEIDALYSRFAVVLLLSRHPFINWFTFKTIISQIDAMVYFWRYWIHASATGSMLRQIGQILIQILRLRGHGIPAIPRPILILVKLWPLLGKEPRIAISATLRRVVQFFV